jgi:beta-glucosidase
VRHLDVCARAVEAGIPLEGYYHWSLTDNFEWGRGFAVQFGLYAVDFDGNLARTPTAAVEPYRRIARSRDIPAGVWAMVGLEPPETEGQ